MQGPALLWRYSPRSLPAGILVTDVADLSRLALAAFLRLAGGPGERVDSAAWLFGSYLDALSVGRTSPVESEPSVVVDDASPEVTVAARIAKATRAVERVLVAFHEMPDPSITSRLVDQRVIEPVIDERGASGFAPLGAPWMTLSIRVLALAAAEMLTRPERLRDDLVVGPSSVEIADRVVASGVAMRSRQTLPWKPARDETSRAPGWPAAVPTLAELVAAQDSGIDDDRER